MSIEEYELYQNIAQGCLTNSKHPDRFVNGIYPKVISRGSGCHLYDLKDRKYVDFICGLGTNLFGYDNQKIKKEKNRVSGDCCHSLPTVHEIIAAKTIKELFPWVEKVKFVNDGSSACSAALIIARSFQKHLGTGEKNLVLSEGYHGWHNEFTSLTPPGNGIVRTGAIQPLLELDKIINPSRVGAIIVEPVIVDDSSQRIEELRKLRAFCTENDIVLIFDETITALRYPKLTVSNCYKIIPDLLIFGKALGNGEKISCVAGKAALMEGKYFVSGTYHGHVRSLVAAVACLDLAKNDPHYDIKHLIAEGIWFMNEFNGICDGIVRLDGYGSRGVFSGDDMQKGMFFQEMCKSGFLFGPSFFLNWDLLPHLKDVLYIASRICEKIRNGDIVLEGSLPSSPFSQKARNFK